MKPALKPTAAPVFAVIIPPDTAAAASARPVTKGNA